MLELLSPAGSPEAAIAAVQSGADAIYLGLDGAFNARRGAKNFDREEYLAALKYCRERGCRVYVALNTLASDRELETLAEIGVFLSDSGADAALVQDLGAARVLRSVAPDLPLHASTQMSVHNLAGVHAAAQLGFSRVVLARELDRNALRFIAAHSPIELEVFVHGALCFCHSGQCYMSALIGRHSGNRGMCAQTCRMPFSMGRRMDAHPMSLKDNCLLAYLDELDAMGVKCVKIEGRMKRPEYTAIVTEIYHRAIHEGAEPTARDYELLELAFSRDGFTDGYYTGNKKDMNGVRGEPDRDALRQFAEVRKGYTEREMRRVPVDFELTLLRRGSRLAASDDEGNRVTAEGPVPQEAWSRGLTLDAAAAQLYKTGGTPYHCRSVSGAIDPQLYLPAAELNALRRTALEALTARRAVPPRRRTGFYPPLGRAEEPGERLLLNVQVSSAEQLTQSLAETAPDHLYIPLRLLAEVSSGTLRQFENCGLVAVLPRVVTDGETEDVLRLLRRARERGVTEALAGNLGHVALARGLGFAVRGDFGLNAFNSQTLRVLRDAGLQSATASFELRLSQVRDMVKALDTELILYGRLPAMVTDQDLLSRADAGETAALSDRRGLVFPVVEEYGGRNVVLNAHKLYLADKLEDVAACGLWAGRLLFTTESPRECVEVVKSYRGLSDYRPNGLTRGLYYRGVE